MTNTYKLVNPYIEGTLNTSVKAKNSLEAGKKFYQSLSENFNNNIPEFYFTIQKGSSGTGKYYNFKVKETRNGDDVETEYKIVNIKNQEEKMRNLAKQVKKQNGGAKKKKNKSKSKKASKPKKKKLVDEFDTEDILNEMDDFSDFDDTTTMESIYVTNYDNLINYWWYDPHIYDIQTLYIPTFYSYITPYIEINL